MTGANRLAKAVPGDAVGVSWRTGGNRASGSAGRYGVGSVVTRVLRRRGTFRYGVRVARISEPRSGAIEFEERGVINKETALRCRLISGRAGFCGAEERIQADSASA